MSTEKVEACDLQGDDLRVLDTLQEAESRFAFQGIKRKLGMHQEKLSRVLHRLENDRLVERTAGGYKLTREGSRMVGEAAEEGSGWVEILQTNIPPTMPTGRLVSRLEGRWFGSLRWFSCTETLDETTLTWLTGEDAIRIRARFRGTRLTLEADRKGETARATKAAHELFTHIAKEYLQAHYLEAPALPTLSLNYLA